MVRQVWGSGRAGERVRRSSAYLACAVLAGFCPAAAQAETLADALVKAYQTSPQLNAERARQRATDENVPQALAGYRPQIAANLGVGLQAVRDLLPDNSIQTATQKPWTIGLTVTQTLFNGFKTANSVRVAELQVQSGREALRNVGQGVLLDAVTAYTNVLANQSLVDAQRANVASLRETLGVASDVIDAFGAVSIACVYAMAQGALEHSDADVAVAISGIAGPDGGSEQKPVGTVVFARATRHAEEREAESKLFPAEDRSEVRRQATLCALELLLP